MAERAEAAKTTPTKRPVFDMSSLLTIGQLVELHSLDSHNHNGRLGTIISPIVDGRYNVSMSSDGQSLRVKPNNLRLVHQTDVPLIIHKTCLKENLPKFNQSSRAADYDKRISYLVSRYDFENLPRWPADGLERSVAEFKDPKSKWFSEHHEFTGICRKQRAFVRIFGGWPSSIRLREMESDGQSMLFSIPFIRQTDAANETIDLRAASDYLYSHRRDRNIKGILKVLLCSPRGSLGSDRTRYPSMRRILGALAGKRLATDEKLEILFGDAAFVRSMMLEIGSILIDPPPVSSPSYNAWADVIEAYTSGAPLEKLRRACVECGIEEPACKTVSFCSACKTVMYCSHKCQKKHWPIHRPDCFEEQGKSVEQAHLDAAESALAEKNKAMASRPEVIDALKEQAARKAQQLRHIFEERQSYEDGTWMPSQRFDISGMEFTQDIGKSGLSIALWMSKSVKGLAPGVEELVPFIQMPGIPSRKRNGEDCLPTIWLFKTLSGAYIVFDVVKLYKYTNGSAEANHGYALIGGYVAYLSDAPRGPRTVGWTSIPRPARTATTSTPHSMFRTWLTSAVSSANVVTHGLYTEGEPTRLGHSTVEHEMSGTKVIAVGP